VEAMSADDRYQANPDGTTPSMNTTEGR
jgi:hypothetical protein